jgi:Heavy metal associated domain 2
MAVSARIAHHVPGRMRVHVHGAKRNPTILTHLKTHISEADGVTRVEANRDTGSLVIHYRNRSPKEFEEHLTEHGQANDTFDLEIGQAGEMWVAIQKEANFLAAHSELARSVVNETKRLDVAVKEATDNTVDLKVLVPLGLAVVSFFYLGTDVATPLWVSLGIFSFNSFVSLHPPLPYPETKNDIVPQNKTS